MLVFSVMLPSSSNWQNWPWLALAVCCASEYMTLQQQQQQLLYSPLSITTQVSHYQKKHSPITPILIINHPLLGSSIYYDPVFLHHLSPGPLLIWSSPVCTAYIYSPSHCLLFAAHAHIIATCFDGVLGLCHLFLISLLALYRKLLSFTLMSLIHLTSAHWSATSFSFLTGQVSLLCTQLLYCLPLIINDTSLLVSSGSNCLNLFHPVWILAWPLLVTGFKHPLQINDLITCYPLHHYSTCVPTSNN